MVKCDWCGNEEFPADEVVQLIFDMPEYKGPYIKIMNKLCPDCSLESRKALAAVELAQKRNLSV